MESRLQNDCVILWKHIAYQKGIIHRQEVNIQDLQARVADLKENNTRLLVSLVVTLFLIALL